tara:strand:+ start:1018 stop:2388 length:1371 start_codon:yes stop_codon:yes gene_type:complete
MSKHKNLEGLELFGFSGKMGTGKNYVAENLFKAMLPVKNTLVLAFADHFKVECCAKDRVDYEKVFVQKDDATRDLLQKRGTEEGRNVYGEDIWTRTLEMWIRRHYETGVERVIITDLRFPNEVEWVKSLGGMAFRIEASKRNMARLEQESCGDKAKLDAIANHSSEIALDGKLDMFDFVINNDYEDAEKVPNQIRDIIRKVIYKNPVPLTIFCDLDDTICHCGSFYKEIVRKVSELIIHNTGISQNRIDELLNKYVYSFEKRYYTLDDFSNSLVKVAMESYVIQDRVMDFDKTLIEEINELGRSVFDKKYSPLNPDSIDMVREMRKYGQVVIYTLGDYTEQMKKIVNLGLLDFQIEIFTHKDENMFRWLQAKYPSKNYVMIGDSFDRDILPAAKAGIGNLIHINGKLSAENTSIVFDDFKTITWEDDQEEKHISDMFIIKKLNGPLMDFLRKIVKE